MKMLEVKNLAKAYDKEIVFENLNIIFKKNEVNFIKGISGIGKTTLLRIILGLDHDHHGEVCGFEELSKACVFQEDRLLDEYSVYLNLSLFMPAKDLKAIDEALDKIDLKDIGLKKVKELSGGQKRRVAILRALLADKDLLVFDEPLKGLDQNSKDRLMAYLLSKIANKTVIWVSHDQSDEAYFKAVNMIDLDKSTDMCNL